MARKKKLDFTGVESFTKAEEGQHIAVIKTIEEKTSAAGNDMLSATFEITRGTSKGARVYDNFVLGETSLWKLKSYLEAIGMSAKGRIVLDLDAMMNKPCIIEVIHEEYNGSMKARIDGYKAIAAEPDEDEDDMEEEEEEVPVKKAKAKAKPAAGKKAAKKPVEDEDWDDEDEDWEE